MTAPARPHRRWLALVLPVAALVVGLLYTVVPRLEETPYASFVRPDGKYRVLVRRKASPFIAMPGQGGDAPGRVELWDAQGHLLQATDVELVQLVEQVEWGEHLAHIKGIADWNLPQ